MKPKRKRAGPHTYPQTEALVDDVLAAHPGWILRDIAEKIGADYGTVRKWSNGSQEPDGNYRTKMETLRTALATTALRSQGAGLGFSSMDVTPLERRLVESWRLLSPEKQADHLIEIVRDASASQSRAALPAKGE